MSWFPSTIENLTTWRFQVIPLIVLFSEATTWQHMQIMTASKLCLLPRIIAGPQSLVSNRPKFLAGTPADVVGVYNGIVLKTLNYFPNAIHPINDLPPFSFWVYNIQRYRSPRRASSDVELDALDRPDGKQSDPPKLRRTSRRLEYEAYLGNARKLSPRSWSAMQMVMIFSGLMALGILVLSILIKDGVGCLTVSLLSLTPAVAGYGSLWSPLYRHLHFTIDGPPGDVVIRTNRDALIVVHCSQPIARSLYTGLEECIYVCNQRILTVLRAISTYLILISLVLLSNCRWQTQLAFGCAWILSAVMSWMTSLIPLRNFWNLSSVYDIASLYPVQSGNAHMLKPELRPTEVLPSFTRTLWYAIRETRSIKWAQTIEAVPDTPQWRHWLQQALEHVDDIDWPATAEKERIVDNRENVYDFPVAEEPPGEGRDRTSMDIEAMPQPASEW